MCRPVRWAGSAKSIVPTEQPVAGANRQIHVVYNYSPLASIERRRASIQVDVIAVGDDAEFTGRAEECGVVVDRLAERVGTLHEVAVPRLVLYGGYHAVVIGV